MALRPRLGRDDGPPFSKFTFFILVLPCPHPSPATFATQLPCLPGLDLTFRAMSICVSSPVSLKAMAHASSLPLLTPVPRHLNMVGCLVHFLRGAHLVMSRACPPFDAE